MKTDISDIIFTNNINRGVHLIIGVNGSGKSFMLRELAMKYRNNHDVVAISNTVHDRFVGIGGIKKIKPSRNMPSSAYMS